MKQVAKLLLCVTPVTLAAPLKAEVYGNVAFAASRMSVTDTGDDEGTATQSDFSGLAGYSLANDLFIEVEALVSVRTKETKKNDNNGLRDGRQIGLRFGRDLDTVSYEAFGLLYDFQNGDNEDEDDRSEGYGFGIGLNYTISDNLEVGGLLGYMGGGDADGENEDDDVLDKTTFISAQGTYHISPVMSSSLRLDYVNGTAPDDDADDRINGLAARLSGTYAVSEQLHLSVFVQSDDWEQPADDDDYQELTIGFGVSYSFGPNADRSRIALPNAALWSANVGGHLK